MLTHTFIPTNIFLLTESLLSSPDQTDYDIKKIRSKERNVFKIRKHLNNRPPSLSQFLTTSLTSVTYLIMRLHVLYLRWTFIEENEKVKENTLTTKQVIKKKKKQRKKTRSRPRKRSRKKKRFFLFS